VGPRKIMTYKHIYKKSNFIACNIQGYTGLFYGVKLQVSPVCEFLILWKQGQRSLGIGCLWGFWTWDDLFSWTKKGSPISSDPSV
jgi:hypothetical protein